MTDPTPTHTTVDVEAGALAQRFHEAYERLAPAFGYETREASAKPWADVPENNRALMTAVCAEIRLNLAAENARIRQQRDAHADVVEHYAALKAERNRYMQLASQRYDQLIAQEDVVEAARAWRKLADVRHHADPEMTDLARGLLVAVDALDRHAPSGRLTSPLSQDPVPGIVAGTPGPETHAEAQGAGEASGPYVPELTRCWYCQQGDCHDCLIATDGCRCIDCHPECLSRYHRPGGDEPGDRIVHCHRPDAHEGDHDEMIDGDRGNWWPATENEHTTTTDDGPLRCGPCDFDNHAGCRSPRLDCECTCRDEDHPSGTFSDSAPAVCICNPTHRDNDPICQWTPKLGISGDQSKSHDEGMDAAIEAAVKAVRWIQCSPVVSGPEMAQKHPEIIGKALVAAAPHIRRAVLNEAADRAIKWGSGKSIYGGGEVAEWLRERAGQEGT